MWGNTVQDGTKVFTASCDKTAKLWDLNSNQCVQIAQVCIFIDLITFQHSTYCLVGQVVKTSASRAEDPRFESCLRRDFSRLSHTSDLEIGTAMATLPCTWRCRVSAGTGGSGVNVL